MNGLNGQNASLLAVQGLGTVTKYVIRPPIVLTTITNLVEQNLRTLDCATSKKMVRIGYGDFDPFLSVAGPLQRLIFYDYFLKRIKYNG